VYETLPSNKGIRWRLRGAPVLQVGSHAPEVVLDAARVSGPPGRSPRYLGCDLRMTRVHFNLPSELQILPVTVTSAAVASQVVDQFDPHDVLRNCVSGQAVNL
jgi:hypothetical protein